MSKKEKNSRFEVPVGVQLVAAGTAAGVTGLATAVKATQSQFRNKLTEYFRHSGSYHPRADDVSELQRTRLDPELSKMFDIELRDVLDAHGIALENATTTHANRMHATKDAAERHEMLWKYIQESHDLKDVFNSKLDSFAEHLGFASKGMNGLTRGTWQRFNFLGGETKKTIAFDIVVASLVGAAGTLMFAKSINTHKSLGDISDQQQHILKNQQALLDKLNEKETARTGL